MRNETGKSNPSNPTDILGRSLKTLSRHNEELFDAPRRYIKVRVPDTVGQIREPCCTWLDSAEVLRQEQALQGQQASN